MNKTRYPELGYEQIDKTTWRFVDLSTGKAIGPYYRNKTELLADLERFATQFGV